MADRAPADNVQLKIRLKEHVRAKLEASAKVEGRTLNAEIVARLERSLWGDRLSELEARVARLEASTSGDEHLIDGIPAWARRMYGAS